MKDRKHCVLRVGDENKLYCDTAYRESDRNNSFTIKTDGSLSYNSSYLSKTNNDPTISTTAKSFAILNAN